MQGSHDSFQKTAKKNRRFDDGYAKQTNPKKFKKNKHQGQAPIKS